MNPECGSCGRKPEEIEEYVTFAQEDGIDVIEWVKQNEGTYNKTNGHFLCDDCYIKAGCPTTPQGWKCP